jgi:hypothetical protein
MGSSWDSTTLEAISLCIFVATCVIAFWRAGGIWIESRKSRFDIVSLRQTRARRLAVFLRIGIKLEIIVVWELWRGRGRPGRLRSRRSTTEIQRQGKSKGSGSRSRNGLCGRSRSRFLVFRIGFAWFALETTCLLLGPGWFALFFFILVFI